MVQNATDNVLATPSTRRAALRRAGATGLAAAALGVGTRREHGAAMSSNTSATNAVYAYGLAGGEPVEIDGMTVRVATIHEFPVLSGMSIQLEEFEPGVLQTPHWHPNAGEVHYVAGGGGTIGIVSPGGERAHLEVRAGSVTFIPRGHYHYVHNTGSEAMQVLAAFTHENPTQFHLGGVITSVPATVMGQVLGVDTPRIPELASIPPGGISSLVGEVTAVEAEAPATPPAPYSINIDEIEPVAYEGGTVTNVRGKELARLDGISFLPLFIEAGGVREPHWHPNAAELIYINAGEAEIGLADPDGSVHTFTVGAGDLAYFPTSWIHYVASSGDEPLDSIVYLSHAAPTRIDLSDMMAFMPREVTAVSLGLEPTAFADFPQRPSIVVAAAGV